MFQARGLQRQRIMGWRSTLYSLLQNEVVPVLARVRGLGLMGMIKLECIDGELLLTVIDKHQTLTVPLDHFQAMNLALDIEDWLLHDTTTVKG